MILHDRTDCLGKKFGSIFLESWVSLGVSESERVILKNFVQMFLLWGRHRAQLFTNIFFILVVQIYKHH